VEAIEHGYSQVNVWQGTGGGTGNKEFVAAGGSAVESISGVFSKVKPSVAKTPEAEMEQIALF
jgi:hypothetical protein